MKRYEITIVFKDGTRSENRVTARNKKDAVARLMNNEHFRAFSDGKAVDSIDVKPIPIEPVDDTRFTVRTIRNKSGWYIVEDSVTGIRVEWKRGMYNATNRPMHPREEMPAIESATALREIGEYLYSNFRDLL